MNDFRPASLQQRTRAITVAMLLVSMALPLAGADFVVTKTPDTNDGTCNSDCSLREAIIAANSNAGADRVILPSGQTFTLTIVPADPAGALVAGSGDLDVTGSLTIEGNGSTIQAGGLDRVLDIQGAIAVTLRRVNLTGGLVSGELAMGGGISVRNASLTLDASSVNANSTASETGIRDNGGGIAVVGSYVPATNTTTLASLTTRESVINGNSGGTGGGVFCALCELALVNTSISNNVAYGDGGAIAIVGDDSSLVFTGGIMINNSAAGSGRGGAVAFPAGAGVADLTRARIMFNLAGSGRAIHNSGAIVTARNNWWGCNYGPGATGPGCGGPMNDVVGSVAVAPWLVLRATPTPVTIPIGATSTVRADVTFNSAGADTTAGGTLSGGMIVSFEATRGTFATPTATTVNASATNVFTASGPKGVAIATVGLNMQTVTTTINVGYAPFTNDPIVAGVTPVRAIHLNELRTRIDAIRTARGLASFGWSTPSPSAGGTILAQHMVDLRTALAQAYTAAGLTSPVYADAVLSPGLPVRAPHVMQLRSAVVGLE